MLTIDRLVLEIVCGGGGFNQTPLPPLSSPGASGISNQLFTGLFCLMNANNYLLV